MRLGPALILVLLAGCSAPDSAQERQVDVVASTTDSERPTDCTPFQARWHDPAFAAAFPGLGEQVRANFTQWPALDAGEGPASPVWPAGGRAGTLEARQNNVSLVVHMLPNEVLAFYLAAPLDSTLHERESLASAFLETVRFEAASKRANMASHLAKNGSEQHSDPGPDGGEATYWYHATLYLEPGNGTASVGGLVPVILENRSEPHDLGGGASEVTFTNTIGNADWVLRVRLPRLVLLLDAGMRAEFDSLGNALAWNPAGGLSSEALLQREIRETLAAGGYGGGVFDDWRMAMDCA